MICVWGCGRVSAKLFNIFSIAPILGIVLEQVLETKRNVVYVTCFGWKISSEPPPPQIRFMYVFFHDVKQLALPGFQHIAHDIFSDFPVASTFSKIETTEHAIYVRCFGWSPWDPRNILHISNMFNICSVLNNILSISPFRTLPWMKELESKSMLTWLICWLQPPPPPHKTTRFNVLKSWNSKHVEPNILKISSILGKLIWKPFRTTTPPAVAHICTTSRGQHLAPLAKSTKHFVLRNWVTMKVWARGRPLRGAGHLDMYIHMFVALV